MGLFDWTEKSSDVLNQGGVIAPDERLPWPQTAAMGVQHVIAMFGATVLAPILMGFDPNIAILMSGVGTMVFFLITGGKVPSYLGSSFAFIGVVIAATAYAGKGPNTQIAVALGGITRAPSTPPSPTVWAWASRSTSAASRMRLGSARRPSPRRCSRPRPCC